MLKFALTACLSLLMSSHLFAGTVAHYSFDGNISDSSGSGLHLNEAGSLSYAAGQFGQAASFNGATYLWNNSTAFDISTSDYAISLWYQTSSTGFQPIVSDINTNSDLGYSVYTHSGTAVVGETRDTTGGIVGVFNPDAPNNLHHVVVQRIGSDLQLYLDGILVNTDSGVTAADSSNDFVVGSRNIFNGFAAGTGGTQTFTGLVDELWVFDSALSVSEINHLKDFNSLNPVPEPSTYALLACGLALFVSRKRLKK